MSLVSTNEIVSCHFEIEILRGAITLTIRAIDLVLLGSSVKLPTREPA
jgi:hypothetical protein